MRYCTISDTDDFKKCPGIGRFSFTLLWEISIIRKTARYWDDKLTIAKLLKTMICVLLQAA
jgi:hypothetical protein